MWSIRVTTFNDLLAFNDLIKSQVFTGTCVVNPRTHSTVGHSTANMRMRAHRNHAKEVKNLNLWYCHPDS